MNIKQHIEAVYRVEVPKIYFAIGGQQLVKDLGVNAGCHEISHPLLGVDNIGHVFRRVTDAAHLRPDAFC